MTARTRGRGGRAMRDLPVRNLLGLTTQTSRPEGFDP
jgi:hypothetical protein